MAEEDRKNPLAVFSAVLAILADLGVIVYTTIPLKAYDSPEPRQYLESVLHDIKTIRGGAFAPYLQNPVIQTLLVPFGGIGRLHLLDLLSKVKG